MQATAKQKSKNKLGQYFTPEIMADFMVGLADLHPDLRVLEPSCGEGVFLDVLQKKGINNWKAYEIDEELGLNFENIQYESFVSAKLNELFDLVIGNPPYIRWGNLEEELKEELLLNPLWNRHFNSLCDYLYIFILKSIELLDDGGQLIFICPEYWMNTTHSLGLRNYMVENGYFEAIYHFCETPIFEKVAMSTIVFSWRKTQKTPLPIAVAKFQGNRKLTRETLASLCKKEPLHGVEYFSAPAFRANERWVLSDLATQKIIKAVEVVCRKTPLLTLFSDAKTLAYHTIGDFCDIGNGLVSGLDKAFQLNGKHYLEREKSAMLRVAKAKDLQPFLVGDITNYIFLENGLSEPEFGALYPNFHEQLQRFRPALADRYQYNREIAYWEWVFPRSLQLFSRPEKRILVPCKERISHKSYFRFALAEAGVFPTQDVTAILKKSKTGESIEFITAWLNNKRVFDWLCLNGIVKGNIVEFSEKPISSIPFPAINWADPIEIELHDAITAACKNYFLFQNQADLSKIDQLFDQIVQIKNTSNGHG